MKLLSLNVEVEPLVKRAIGTRGFASAGLIAHWEDIVGAEMARHCLPLSLRFPKGSHKEGTLTLQCRASFALELQHSQMEFLARLNAYFGYKAIARLKIEQGPVYRTNKRKKPLPLLSQGDIEQLDRNLTSVTDSVLHEKLARFGQAMLRRQKRDQSQ